MRPKVMPANPMVAGGQHDALSMSSAALPGLRVLREGQKKPAPYFDPSTPGFLGLVCAALHFVTFDWVSWGNQLTRDIKEQTAQEVTNFGILSALMLSVCIGISFVVDDSWTGGYLLAMSVLFEVTVTCFTIALLTSALLLLIFNEAPSGRASARVIDGTGAWMKVPGLAFLVGMYGFCAQGIVYQFHTYNLWLNIALVSSSVLIASASIIGAVSVAMRHLYCNIRDYGILLVDSDEAINAFIREQYVSRQLGGDVARFSVAGLKAHLLDMLDAHDIAELSERRVDAAASVFIDEVLGSVKPLSNVQAN